MRPLITATLTAAALLAAPAVIAREKLAPEAQLEKLLEGRVAGEPQKCIPLSATPPKPAGNAVWNIDWTAKVRFRSHTMLMIGADFGGMSGGNAGESTPAPAKKKKCKGPLGIPLPEGAC